MEKGKWKKEPVFLQWLNMSTVSVIAGVAFRCSVRRRGGAGGVTGPSIQKAVTVRV